MAKLTGIIKQVKESVKIPVIGNGDIKSIYDAEKMINDTNCDAVMIGRGCLGNPWLIKQTIAYLENGVIIDDPTPLERLEMILLHIDKLLKFKPEKQALLEIRTHIGYYLKGVPNASELKNNIFKTKSIDELKNLIEEFKGEKKYEN